MNGIDNIVAHILEDANSKAAQIKAEAGEQADSIINAAMLEGREKADAMTGKAQAEAENSVKLAQSSAELVERNAVLSAKIDAIQSVLDKSLERMRNMPLSDYFSYVEKLAVENCQKGEGIIYFSDADLKRMPKSFAASLNKKLAAKDSRVTVSDEPRNIDGGFVMAFGDIEENCSFEAMLAANRDNLSDIINSVLFG